MSKLKVRLDVLHKYLETRESIPRSGSTTYWSQWIKSAKDDIPEGQEQDFQKSKHWNNEVQNIQLQIETFVTTLSAHKPHIRKKYQQQVVSDNNKTRCPRICTERHFFDANSIYETLIQDDVDGKNIFGQYKDPLLTEYCSILEAYKSNGMHLSQALSLLNQSLYEDLPSLQRKVEQLDKQLKGLGRRLHFQEIECSGQEKNWANECQMWGIENVKALNDIDNEVIRLIKEKLPFLCQDLELEFKETPERQDRSQIQNACLYFQEFSNFLQIYENENETTRAVMLLLNGIFDNKVEISNIIRSKDQNRELCQELNQLKFFVAHRIAEQSGSGSSHSFIPSTPSKTLTELKSYESKIQCLLKKLQKGLLPLLNMLAENEDYRNFIIRTMKTNFNTLLKIRQNISQDKKQKQMIQKELIQAKDVFEKCTKRVNDLKLLLENELKSHLEVSENQEICIVTSI